MAFKACRLKIIVSKCFTMASWQVVHATFLGALVLQWATPTNAFRVLKARSKLSVFWKEKEI